MRVIITGSRRWKDRKRIENRLFDLAIEHAGNLDDLVIVHGSAKGADRIAHQEAEKAGLRVEPHPADWEQYGKRAGVIRNEEMAELGGDLCIAFWDGRSKGTADMMERAKEHGIPVEVIV